MKGISQEELARRIGIDPTTLSWLERSLGQCKLNILEKAADFFNTDFTD